MKPETETKEKSENGNEQRKLNRKKCRKSQILGWWITSRSFYSWTALNVLTKRKRKTFSWDMPWENIHRAVSCLTKALTNLLKVGKSQRVFFIYAPSLNKCSKWFREFYWSWDEKENTLWYLLTFKGQLPENIEDKELEWNRKFVTQKGAPGVEQPEVDSVTGYIY